LEAGFRSVDIADEISFFRLHPGSKTVSQRRKFLKEDWRLLTEHIGLVPESEHAKVRRWLGEYEADSFVDVAYSLLVEEGRLSALRYLLGCLPKLHLAPDRRAVVGALARTLITGRCPSWWGKSAPSA
jgi:hypothetical protein